ncbi:MAG: hypothetical protein AB1410_04210 [Acidobacteriota bacterium]
MIKKIILLLVLLLVIFYFILFSQTQKSDVYEKISVFSGIIEKVIDKKFPKKDEYLYVDRIKVTGFPVEEFGIIFILDAPYRSYTLLRIDMEKTREELEKTKKLMEITKIEQEKAKKEMEKALKEIEKVQKEEISKAKKEEPTKKERKEIEVEVKGVVGGVEGGVVGGLLYPSEREKEKKELEKKAIENLKEALIKTTAEYGGILKNIQKTDWILFTVFFGKEYYPISEREVKFILKVKKENVDKYIDGKISYEDLKKFFHLELF